MCKGHQSAEHLAFQFFRHIRDCTHFHLVCVAEEKRNIRTVPCRFLILERKFQNKIVEERLAGSALRMHCSESFGWLAHDTIHLEDIGHCPARIGNAEGTDDIVRVFSINLFQDFVGILF